MCGAIAAREFGINKLFNLWLVSLCALAPCATEAAAPNPFKIIHSFAGTPNDGAMPTYGTSLAVGGSTLYGVTQGGGSKTNGVLFKVNTSGSGYSVLRDFNGKSVYHPTGSTSDGAIPTGTPLLDGSTLYGMTVQGGSNGFGFGTIYRINTDGNGFQIMHHFGALNDGVIPEGSLTLSGTTLYGMTGSGGSNFAQGIIFKIQTSGEGYQILHHFRPGQDDGAHGGGSLLISENTMFGMTRLGGEFLQGVIFRMNLDGTGYQILRHFTGTATDGAMPFSSLILSGTTLYGMTSAGGPGAVGTVFKIETNGTGFQLLHAFAINEGWQPNGDLTLVGNKLYGMTRNGGVGGLGAGTLFEINPDGSGYSGLHTFSTTTSNGTFPFGSLAYVNGALYGMASLGGSEFQGCVFSFGLGGGGTGGTAILSGTFSDIKEACKTRRGVLSCQLNAALTVQNSGDGPSTPTRLRYFLSADDLLDASDAQFGEKKWPKIKAGKSKRLKVKAKTTESTNGKVILAVNDAGVVVASVPISVP